MRMRENLRGRDEKICDNSLPRGLGGGELDETGAAAAFDEVGEAVAVEVPQEGIECMV